MRITSRGGTIDMLSAYLSSPGEMVSNCVVIAPPSLGPSPTALTTAAIFLRPLNLRLSENTAFLQKSGRDWHGLD